MKRYSVEPSKSRLLSWKRRTRRMSFVGVFLGTVWIAGGVSGCGVHPGRGSSSMRIAERAVRIADRLHARARVVEPRMTTLVRRLARRFAGRLFKPQYRLKTRQSLVRKIRTILKRRSGLVPAYLRITDALRYTVRVEDRPAGRHVRAIARGLATLERLGHRVVEAKNYWPRGDNYSGVNCVLEEPGGLLWELQFHTAASIRVNFAQRDLYEELRRTTTPVARKRALFDRMARGWETVFLPWGILTPKALHARERIIRIPRP